MEPGNRNKILTVLFIGVLMGALDIAIIGPALPTLQKQFGTSERLISWVFNIYVLFNLVGTPLMAKLSDQFGRRVIYLLDVMLFAAGSLVVAAAPSFGFVLLGRAIQGFGAGGIFPVASAVIGDTFPPEKRGGALGLIGAVFGLAFLIGPILGGVVLAFASWQWLFLLNLPIAVLVIIMGARILPSNRPAHQRVFDFYGMLVLTLMLASLAWSLNNIDAENLISSLFSPVVLPFLGMVLVLLFVLIAIERSAQNPILPLSLFDRTQLRLTYALSAGAGAGEASLVFIPILAVSALADYGVDAKKASWMLMPVVLAMAFGSPTAGKLLDKLGSRTVILTGTVVMTIGLVMLGMFSGYLELFILSGALIGLGMSALLGAPMRYIMLNESKASERSVAQGVLAVFTSTGQLTGAALTGAMAASLAQTQGTAAGYSLAFMVIGGLSLGLVLLALLLKKRAAEQATARENEIARSHGAGAASIDVSRNS